MKKRRYAFLALSALMAAGALLASGCKQAGGQAEKPNAGGTTAPGNNSGGQGGGTQNDQSTFNEEIEFSRDLANKDGTAFGTLTVWISQQNATVRFRNAAGVEYGGNGPVAKDGTVKFQLHEVNDAKAPSIPFEGQYQANERRFILKHLTNKYPVDRDLVVNRVEGNVSSLRKTFVRYMEKLHGNLSAAVVITLEGDRVSLTAWYGEAGAHRHCITAQTQIKGNEAETEMDFDGTVYKIVMKFTEDDENATDDSRTNWYLGEKNTVEGGAKYTGGFRYYIKEQVNKYTGALIGQDKVTSKSFDLFDSPTGAPAKKLAALAVNIIGNEVHLSLKSTEYSLDVATEKNKLLVRTLALVPMKDKPGLYESKPMCPGSDQVAIMGGGNESKLYGIAKNPAKDSVFVFEQEHNGSYENCKYNTYDFRITDYDPERHTFCLNGKWLKGETLCKDSKRVAAAPLIGTENGTALYYQTGKDETTAMDGNHKM